MDTNLRRREYSGAGANSSSRIPPNYHNYDDINSNCSTPYASAPSSPTRPGFFSSAPTSPLNYAFPSLPANSSIGGLAPANSDASSISSFEFVFSDRVHPPDAEIGLSSADELFLNGQIRPMNLSPAHLHRPTPLLYIGGESERENDENVGLLETVRISRVSRLRDRSQRRRARSHSPLRNTMPLGWISSDDVGTPVIGVDDPATPATGRLSRRWNFLKDFLRSKSEGRKSPAPEKVRKEMPARKPPAPGKRRSAHELHYTAKRAEEEGRRKKTYLPYKQGVLGCLGFNSKAINGFVRALNPISST